MHFKLAVKKREATAIPPASSVSVPYEWAWASSVKVCLQARIIGYYFTTMTERDLILYVHMHLIESGILICNVSMSRSSFKVKGQIYEILKVMHVYLMELGILLCNISRSRSSFKVKGQIN